MMYVDVLGERQGEDGVASKTSWTCVPTRTLESFLHLLEHDAAMSASPTLTASNSELRLFHRPGADEVSEKEELSRVIPVIQGLRKASASATGKAGRAGAGITISVDTRRAAVAAAAVEAGAHVVNDVSGGNHDRAMLSTVARAGVPMIMMHMR